MNHLTYQRPFQGQFVLCRLGLATINLHTKFEQWHSQGLEVGWAQGVWRRKSPSGVQRQSPSGGLGRSPLKPDMHIQSAVDKRIVVMCS